MLFRSEEIKELQRDLQERIRIVTEEGYIQIRKLLMGQKAAEDIKIPKIKEILCPKGKKITGEHLEMIKDQYLDRIKVQNSKVQEKIDAYLKEINDYIKYLQSKYDEKVDRLKKGDELSPGVNKLVDRKSVV